MAQTGNENESFAYLEARSTHRATSTPDSSRGVTIGNGSETNASSVSPLDPEIGPLKGHTNHSIRSKNSHQDDPWWGNTVLTLDGGGVKGYSSLLILEELMSRIQKFENELYPDDPADCSAHPLQHRSRGPVRSTPTRASKLQSNEGDNSTVTELNSRFLPAHYFDYIGGTSTGGLIAIMLGLLSMTVKQCCRAYEDLADSIFGHRRYIHVKNTLIIRRPKYSYKLLEGAIKKIVEEHHHLGDCDAVFSQQPFWDMCRTIVVSRQKHFTGDQTPYLFRSYRHPRRRSLAPLESVLERSPDDNVNYPIWKVARATSAAPSYFKAIKMRGNNEGFKFIDGGFGVNNPSEEVYRSVRQLSNNQPGAVSDFVSIGTGKKNMGGGKDYLLPLRLIREAVKLATESERTHETMQDRSNQEGLRYNRFNVESGLGNIKLDTWKGKRGTKTLELIRRKTNEYLQTPGMRDRIDEVARRLVQIRRSRARQFNSDHWERFCHGVEYGCCAEICRSRNRMPKLDELRQHLQIEHSFTEEKIKSSLEQCKFYPLFEPTA